MRLRGMVVLIALAALAGTPSPASAANNTLLAPAATRVAGAVLLSVRYEGKFAASAVTATVAGMSLPMALASGTARSGTWVATPALVLPGTDVTFRASVAQGGEPVLTWSASFSSSTPPPPTAAPPATPFIGPGDGDAPDAPTPALDGASATMDPDTSVAPAAGPTAPAPGTTPAIEPPWAPELPGSPVPAVEGGSDPVANAPVGSSGAEATAVAVGDEPNGSGVPAGAPVEDGAEPGEAAGALSDLTGDGLNTALMLVGLAGVAALAVIGSALLVAGRRRRAAAESAPVAGPGVMTQRTLRRGRVVLPDDPIVAALGVGNDAPRRRRRRAGQVDQGPGEPEVSPRSRRGG